MLGAGPARAEDEPEAAPPPEPSATEIFVAEIYETYTGDSDKEPSAAADRDVYSKRLRALFDKDAAETPEGDAGRLDFDPFVNGQDWEIGGLKVKEIYRSGDEAQVRADFANFGEPRSILFSLVREDGAWRIDDMGSTLPPRWILSEILAGTPAADPSETGE